MKRPHSLLGVAALVSAVLVSAVPVGAQTPIGLEAIERFDLIDAPRYAVRTYQYSSHDPTGGNDDRGHYLYDVGSEHVLLDVKGPGCIYRFWFTGAIDGSLRFYFDGESTPRVNMTRRNFFSGTNAPFLAPLVGNDTVSSGGYYCYLPMPFREGCKITATGEDLYYNVTFQRFASATGVTTFTGTEDSSAARGLWNSTGTDPKPDHGNTVITNTINLPVGSSVTLANVASAGTLQQLELTIPGLLPDDLSRTILSGLKLRMYWDGSGQASVDVPVNSFFGSGLRAKTVDALPVGIDGQRLYCFFPMPFAAGALVRLANSGSVAVDNLTYTVRYTALADPTPGVGRFHAKFRSETPTTTGQDYLILEETGAGHFVGVVQTMEADGSSIPDRWYLEGDERIYVDGASTPALYGTGTEDFYNGGWYFSHGTFTLPVHGCPDRYPPLPDPPNPLGDTCYRFFLSDLIPFTTGIKVGIEHGWADSINLDVDSVAFYYKMPQPLAGLSDALDVGNTTSENQHGYVPSGQTWSGSKSGSYEGDNDGVSISDNGRRLALGGGSQFTVAVTPTTNGGVLLRRRMDYSFPHQEARVYVDNVPVGYWYDPGENDSHIWRDAEFMIPPALTQGKSAITVRTESVSPHSDWTEHYYWVYTLAGQAPALWLDPESLEPVTTYRIDPPADSFSVANVGGGTLTYSIADNADWLNVVPDGGSSTGEIDTIQVNYDVAALDMGTHTATITVSAPGADNSPREIHVHLTVNPIPGDFDADHDVDQADFGHFQTCLTGSGMPQTIPGCDDASLDDDGDVDHEDFMIFKGCLSGEHIPADPACAQ